MIKEYAFLDELEPQGFFRWFGEISAIPRGSGKEEKLADFIMRYALARNYPCDKDAAGNIFVRVPATEGYEDQPSILFQAHMDMVWEQREGMDFDFENEPLHLRLDGDRLTADGTTLGADNGVGLATMLALADTDCYPHPPLEYLFTVEEETGLWGVRSFDMSRIRSRRMINMDCGYSDVLCVSTAGRIQTEVYRDFPCEALPEAFACFRVVAGGGKGGHSGISIHKGRMCAVNVLGAVLRSAGNIRLCALQSESQSIIREASAVIALPSAQSAAAIHRMQIFFQKLKAVFEKEDPDIFLSVEPVEAEGSLSEAASEDICSLLSIFHTGPYRADGQIPDAVITSGSVEELRLNKGSFLLGYTIRSSNDTLAEIRCENFKAIARKFGMELRVLDRFSGWPERVESDFRSKFIAAYKARFGKAPDYERVHGGVEIGAIVGAIPEMDGVGYAPSSHGAHTPEEYLELSQVQPFWDVLTDVLAEKAD